jgi:hypothetical protein
MTLKLPSEQSTNLLLKKLDRDAALRGCLHHGPRRIYTGLLHHTREQKWKDGSASHMFKEIYGMWPRNQDKGPPMPPPIELRAWIALRPKRSKRHA